MKHTRSSWRFRIALIAVTCLGASACGGGLSGTYLGTAGARFEQFDFKSGGRVEFVYFGTTRQGTYDVDGGKVSVTAGGETVVFTMVDNCIDGGKLVGKYCKK